MELEIGIACFCAAHLDAAAHLLQLVIDLANSTGVVGSRRYGDVEQHRPLRDLLKRSLFAALCDAF